MTIRNHSTILLLLASLTACYPQPAQADVLPLKPSAMPVDPVNPDRRPATFRDGSIPAGPDFGAGRRGGAADAAADNAPAFWGPFGTWTGVATGPLQSPVAAADVRCKPPVQQALPVASVPGPLPVLGVGVMFRVSRSLRRRIIR
jgi:hypothetical protein